MEGWKPGSLDGSSWFSITYEDTVGISDNQCESRQI